jgi:hypothetical protein
LRLSASSCSFVGDWEAFMPRVMRMLAAAMVLVFAGTMIEARTGEALAPAAKPTRAKKAKPVPRGAAVRPSSPPTASASPASSSHDRSTAGGGGGY